jgi:hypothetical protein
MRQNKGKRTGMQIYCDCLKTGREVRAKMTRKKSMGGGKG